MTPAGLIRPLALLLVFALQACGGGSDNEDTHRTTQPVDCAATPERCK